MNLCKLKWGFSAFLFYAFSLLLIHSEGVKAESFVFEKYCSKDKNVPSVFVAIDVTTPYDAQDKKKLNKMLARVIKEQEGGNHVLITLIKSHQMKSEVVFEGCVPACLKTGIERLTGCSDGLIKTDKKRYLRKVVSSLKKHLTGNGEEEYSALIFTLEGILKRIADSDQAVSKLYIYSDMIENSQEISGRKFWSKSPKEILKLAKKKYGYAPKNVNGDVYIYIYGFGRSDAKDRKFLSRKKIVHIKKFWEKYFGEWGIPPERIHWVTN